LVHAGAPYENCKVFPTVLITVCPPTVVLRTQPVAAFVVKSLVNPPFMRVPPDEEFEVVTSRAVGVPLITPLVESVNPAGRAEPLASLQVYGLVPPDAASVVEYADPFVAPGTVDVVMVGAPLTVTVTVEEVVEVEEVVVVVDVKSR
jgi:hypothetical protein